MPTVRRNKHGFVIVSNRRGRFITHELTPDGAKMIQTRLGISNIDRLEIDVATLIELKKSSDAYTNKQRCYSQWQGRRQRRAPANAPVPPPAPSKTVASAPTPATAPDVEVVLCPKCSAKAIATAQF